MSPSLDDHLLDVQELGGGVGDDSGELWAVIPGWSGPVTVTSTCERAMGWFGP